MCLCVILKFYSKSYHYENVYSSSFLAEFHS